MRNLKYILVLLLFSYACFEKNMNLNDLKLIDGVYFNEKSDEIYTGKCYLEDEDGNVVMEVRIEDGEKAGTWFEYFPSGEKMSEGSYQQGKQHGTWRSWYASGKIEAEASYINGSLNGTGKR